MATTKAFELAQLSALTTVDASGNVSASTNKIANASGDLTLDSVAGDIVLDAHGNQVIFKGSGGQVGFIDLATGRMDIKSSTADQQMRFQGNDAGVPINALVLDMAASGAATFLDQVTIGGNLIHAGNLTIDAGGDITLNADGADVILADGAVEFGRFKRDNGHLVIKSETIDKSVIIKGTTTSNAVVTALTFDMANSGRATFNENVVIQGDLTVEGTQVTLNTTALDVEDKNITLNYHASNDTSASADGAGITIQDAVNASTDATILWNASIDRFAFSHGVNVSGDSQIGGNLDLAASTTETRSLQIGQGRTGDGISLIDLVGDTTYSDYGFRIQRAGTDSGKSSLLHKGTGNLEIRAIDAATIRFKTTDADRMQIKSAGDIHFYDTAGDPGMVWDASEGSDGALLIGGHTALRSGSVAGRNDAQLSLESTNFHNASFVANQNTANGYHLIIGKSRGTDVGDVDIVQALDEIGSLVFAAADGTDLRPKVAQISAYVPSGTTPGVNTVSGELRFGTTNQAQDVTNHMVLDKDGKVGIGILTPETLLHVQKSSSALYTSSMSGVASYTPSGADMIQVRNSNTGVNDIYAGIWFETGTGATNTTGTDRAGRIALVVDNDSAYSSNFVFQTRGSAGTLTEKMRITQEGNVGIGTDDPVTALHVDPGYVTLGTSTGTDNSWINNVEDGNLELVNEGRSTNDGAVRINRKNNPAGDTTYFRDTVIYDGKSNVVLFVDGSEGKVGIGTDTPSRLLDIDKTDATQYDRSNIPDDGSGATIRIINNDIANGPSYSGIHLQAYGASSNIARGFIGIVNDENWINGGWSGTHHHLTFATRGSSFGNTRETMILTSDGYLGIGEDWGDLSTKRPMHKLDVDGAIATRQVRHSIRPTLNLDFANSKELDPRITFYRDSIATYYDSKGILRYANVNEPRFDHDPITGKSKGLLIEEAEDNIFSNTNNPEKWSLTSKNGNFGWQSNGMKSPDGTMNATKFFITGSDPYWYQNNLTLNGTYTFSYWIKAEGNAVGKQYTTRITNISGNISTADTLPGEWTRRSFTFTTSATSTAYIGVEAPDNSPADGDVLSIWGAQLEKLPFVSSYMPSLNTFRSRSSNATYYDKDGVLKTAPRNAPRYGYTHDGHKFVETGLIKEEASTNHLTNHLAKDTANWYMNGSGFSGVTNPTHTFSQTQTAPDGSLTAVELNASNTSTPNISTAYNMGNTSSWTRGSWSLFVKPFGNTDVYSMWVDNGSGTTGATVQFQISTMSYQATNTRGGTVVEYGRIEKLGDGWYRLGMVVSGTLPQFQCRCYAADGVFGANEDGYGSATGGSTSSSNGTYFWGGQVEEGTAATGATISSYIYGGGGTTRAQDIGLGTAATRKIDVAHLDNILYADWNNEEEGTFYTEYEVPYDIEDISVNYRVLERHTEGTGQNVTSILLNSGTNQTNAGAYNNSGWQALMGVSNSLGVTDKNVLNKLAFAFKDNDFGVSIQGSPIAQDSSGTVTRGATRLQLGSNSSLANTLNGHLKIVKFYPERLSNAELVALTENN